MLDMGWPKTFYVRHGSYWHFEGKAWVGLQIMSKARAVLTITLSDWTRLAFLDSSKLDFRLDYWG